MSTKNIEDAYPLSSMQQGMLFHSLYEPASGTYIMQLVCDLHGELNVAAFIQAWQQIVDRHPVLRTAFVWEKLDQPLQIVGRQVKLPWEMLDWRDIPAVEQQDKLENLLYSDRKRGFELSKAPLMRLTLIQTADTSYHFVWNHHHLLLDGWSVPIVFQEAIACYKELYQGDIPVLKPSRPYRDYIAWLQQQNLSLAQTFWQERLKGFTAPTPLGVDKIANSQDVLAEQKIKLSAATTTALQSLAQQQHLTLSTLVQGAWALLLKCYSGQEDVLFGTTVSGRPSALLNVESMVGLFINTLPTRVKVDPQESLITWLHLIQEQHVEARQYEYSPLVKIHGWSQVPRDLPLFESIVVFENYPVDSGLQKLIAELNIVNVRCLEKTNFPLTISVNPGSELTLKIAYNSQRFDRATITRMLGHLQTLLTAMAANPNQRLAELALLTKSEQQQLQEWNQTQVDYPQTACIHHLFALQVKRTPDAVAVIFEDEQLTYRELNQRANQLAHYLQKLGVTSEVLVGICVERSLEMLVGLLGILKVGGAYVPLDPAYPPERLVFMLKDAQISVLVTQKDLLERLPESDSQVICLDSDGEIIRQESQENPDSQITSSALAYVIYTSGSTGKPKGVQIQHRGVVNFLISMESHLKFTQSDILLAVTSISFDIAVLELYLPLITGAHLVLVSRAIATDAQQLHQQLESTHSTVMQATPATWRMLLTSGWSGNSPLKILCGGEALTSDLAAQLLSKGTSLWNLYGPTETTIWSTAYEVKKIPNSQSVISIGRPIANTQIYILDAQGKPTPVGVPGELHIGGDGLARGYLNHPELTAQKFIPNPVGDSKLYKTGDLARYLPNGEIEYLGRIDYQVKIRGFRIELGEIEATLNQHPQVRETVAIALANNSDDQYLVAYIVPDFKTDITGNELRDFLLQKLPEYMIPAIFVNLAALPLTPNGKVDRKALPFPDISLRNSEVVFVSPRTSTEETLAAIYADVLGLEKVSIHDNFFALGGHSLLATKVISRLREAFKIDLPLRTLFEQPTIAGLAARLETMRLALMQVSRSFGVIEPGRKEIEL